MLEEQSENGAGWDCTTPYRRPNSSRDLFCYKIDMFPYERIEDQFTFYTLYIFLYQKMFTWVDQLISETNFKLLFFFIFSKLHRAKVARAQNNKRQQLNYRFFLPRLKKKKKVLSKVYMRKRYRPKRPIGALVGVTRFLKSKHARTHSC